VFDSQSLGCGCFQDKEQILDILEDEGYIKYPVVEEPERHTKLNLVKSKPRKLVSGVGEVWKQWNP